VRKLKGNYGDLKFRGLFIACLKVFAWFFLDMWKIWSSGLRLSLRASDMSFRRISLGGNMDRFKGKEIEEIRKEIVDRYKEEDEYPKILIVTDMLLTGLMPQSSK